LSISNLKLTSCVKPDLYVCTAFARRQWKGLDDVAGQARCATGMGVEMEMRLFACHEQRMLRALHGRWPYRRSHCRHDLHWLVRVQSQHCWCGSGRQHSMLALRVGSRRPQGG